MPVPTLIKDDPTGPMAIRVGDRLHLENKIELLNQQIISAAINTKDRADDFYKNRMAPLEKIVRIGKRWTWLAIGVSGASFLFSLVMLVLLVFVVMHLTRRG